MNYHKIIISQYRVIKTLKLHALVFVKYIRILENLLYANLSSIVIVYNIVCKISYLWKDM